MPLSDKNIRFSSPARADLVGIGTYTQDQWGKEQKAIYLGQLKNTLQTLLISPRSGTDRGDISAGLRSRATGSHIIYYRTAGFGLEVMRVLHRRMDPKRHLLQGDMET